MVMQQGCMTSQTQQFEIISTEIVTGGCNQVMKDSVFLITMETSKSSAILKFFYTKS